MSYINEIMSCMRCDVPLAMLPVLAQPRASTFKEELFATMKLGYGLNFSRL
jgi:hypothetical protein